MVQAPFSTKSWIVLLVMAIVFTLSTVGFLYLSSTDKLPTLGTQTITSSVSNNYNTQTYEVSKNLPPQITSVLKASSLDNRDIQVIIEADVTKPIAWYLYQGKKLSGFSFSVYPKLITVTIYLSPDLPENQLLGILNHNLISGLMYAAESTKDSPRFDTAFSQGSQIAMNLIETTQPIIYIPGIPLSKQ